MKTTARFDARAIRDALLARGGPAEDGFARFAYRPFDNRWLYWETDGSLLDRPRPDYRPHVFKGNRWLVLQNKARPDLSPPLAISHIGDLNQMNSGVYCVPVWLSRSGLQRRPNLSGAAQSYLERLGASVENLFHHVLTVLHDPTYNQVNADVLRAEGPRIPLPCWSDGEAEGAAEELARSASRGRELARLLDPDTPVPGVTQGVLRPEIAAIAVPTTTDGHNMTGDDFVPWCINTGKSLIPLTLRFFAQKRNLLIPLELSGVMHQGTRSLPWCTTPIEAESSLGPDSHHPIISVSGIPSAVMVLRILHPIPCLHSLCRQPSRSHR